MNLINYPMNYLQILMIIWSGAAIMLAGVAVGGILVFRTKRESYETLFPPKKGKPTGPVHVDDMFQLDGGAEPAGDINRQDPVHEAAQVQNAKFMAQLAKDAAAAKEVTL